MSKENNALNFAQFSPAHKTWPPLGITSSKMIFGCCFFKLLILIRHFRSCVLGPLGLNFIKIVRPDFENSKFLFFKFFILFQNIYFILFLVLRYIEKLCTHNYFIKIGRFVSERISEYADVRQSRRCIPKKSLYRRSTELKKNILRGKL